MKIEKNIPIPPYGARHALLKEMRIGDSALIAKGRVQPEDYEKVTNPYRKSAERLGYKITIRTVDEGIRLWRTK